MVEEKEAIKKVITGELVPKSMGQIELEKNFSLLCSMVSNIIERIHDLETDVAKLQRQIAELASSNRKFK